MLLSERPIAGSMRRNGSAFQLGRDGTRQPLPVAGRPLHENAGSCGSPIQIPPGRRGIGDAQLFGKGTIVVADLTRDFMPPLPSFRGNSDRLVRKVDNYWNDRSAMRRNGSAFQLGRDSTRQPLPVAGRPLHENAGSCGSPIQIPPGRRGVGDAQPFGKGKIVVADLTRDFIPPLPSFRGN
jgi:hypothetical protein